MAIDFSKYLNKLDARARVLVLLGGIVVVGFLIYFIARYLGGSTSTVGPSNVANAPGNINPVPGGQLTPEYQRTLIRANQQIAQQAQLTGGSAVPTVINLPNQPQAAPTNCIVCSDEMMNNVKTDLDNWVSQGKLSPEIAAMLNNLADKNVPVSEYAAYLDQLVKQGKLTPEQARELLDKYQKQHANRLLQDSAKTMDELIKSGQLPLDVANELLALQKQGGVPQDYAARLQALVREGKLSPDVAQQLLSQYTQQRAKEIIAQSIASLHRMAQNGEITTDVETQLTDLEQRMVPVDLYQTTLINLQKAGKMTPAAAQKILDEFRQQKAAIGSSGTLSKLLQDAENAAFNELATLVQQKKISEDTAAKIGGAIQKNVSMEAFTTLISQLMQAGQLTPEIAKLKINDYKLIKDLRNEMQQLNALQANNATAAQYADELKRAVQAGILTPDQAKQLMQEYLAAISRGPGVPTGIRPGNAAYEELRRRAQEAAAAGQVGAGEQFTQAEQSAQQESAADRQARIGAMMAAMSNQAQSLVAAWQPPTMAHHAGVFETKQLAALNKTETTTTTTTTSGGAAAGLPTRPLIKAGTIIFAVLDTTANSDYPDVPIMATVVDGKFKGAKLLGKLQTTKSVSGQMDRISLVFSSMDTDEWITSKTINAFAIDPDTARSVMASSVDYHYALRFGSVMATSFLQGYAGAITNAGTSTTGIFGTSTTHPSLSPGSKIAVGLGQIGQTLGQATSNYINTPPTVKVNAGVGLGIMFMQDVAQ